MTHPDILRTENYGSFDDPPEDETCAYCGEHICLDETDEALQSADGRFCDRRCCDEYYGISGVSH